MPAISIRPSSLPDHTNAHANVDRLDALFNKRSGDGMTGFSDLREVHRLVAEGNEDAKLALDVYVHRIVGYIGNFTAQMGGVDVITFTAGVGENIDVVRKMVCDKLAPFGVKLDEGRTPPVPEPRTYLHPGFQDHHLRHFRPTRSWQSPRKSRRAKQAKHLRQRLLQVSEIRSQMIDGTV